MINDALRTLLIVAFNNHPHVVVLPNAKATLQVMDANAEKVVVRKILMMVGFKTIFSDIICDNLTVKNRVGEHVFCYIVSGLRWMCTPSHQLI